MQFDRIIYLIGEEKFNVLKNKKVLIVGCGGVGSYALESLVRSGINNIGIVDFDKIDITNLNRQVIANIENIGKLKVLEAKKRALLINPSLNIKVYEEFLDEANIENIIKLDYDYVVDACDTIKTKVELIKYCTKNNIKIISSMGTAKKIDPTKLEIIKLDKTSYDPLAKCLRRKLRKDKINTKIDVISSKEKVMDCDKLGSFMFVPATAGILCAKYIIEDIINSIN